MTVTSDSRKKQGLTDFRGAPDPLVRVAALGFVGFETDDADRLVDYYINALDFAVSERTGDAAYLTTGANHHCVVIHAGAVRARTAVGFEIVGALDEAAGRLKAAGVDIETRSDPVPGIAASIVIAEPGGTPLHLYQGQKGSGQQSVPGVRPTKLGHVASHVPDLPEIQTFYEDVLGFRWSDTVGDYFAFLRCGPDHHTINLLARPTKDGSYRGMHHIAFEMRDLAHLRDGLDQISKHGYLLEWGLGRHGAGHNLFSYHRDPDGNLVELFTELDLIFDERTGYFEPRPWHEDYPQGPKVWEPGQPSANIWGPLPPS
jgi:catechol-2,3-dioxygenase